MKMMNSTAKKTIAGALCAGFAATGAACSSEGSLNHYLEIEGDRNVHLDSGEQQELRVRYYDGEDRPVSGAVYFEIQGNAEGAQLDATSVQTDSDGVAEVELDAQNDDQASFTVEADAADADPVEFSVSIEAPVVPLAADGTYEIESSFDLVSGLEDGTVRDVVHNVLDFTGEPGTFLLNLLVSGCESLLDDSCPIDENDAENLGPVLTTVIENQAPDFVGDLLQIGSDFHDLVHDFEVVSELQIDGRGQGLSADHSLTGVQLVFGNERHHHTLGDMGVENLEAYSVSADLTEDESEMTIGTHELPMAYGAMLTIGLNEIAAAIDDTADDLEDFISNHVPCDAVAEAIEDAVGILDVDQWELACEIGIGLGVDQLMGLIEGLDDTGLELSIEGTAQPMDTTNTNEADVLRSGEWDGTLEYAGSVSAELDPSDNTFRGERIDD